MGMTKDQVQRAIFMAAVCSETYTQFMNPDGSFVLPSAYTLYDTIEAKSLNRIWEPFGFIIQSDTEIIVAFRGTSSTTNWIDDAMASQIPFKYIKESCLTHRGFTNIYASARKQVLSALSKLSSDKALFITGHSLGGALATMCAVDIASNTDYTPFLFTYGSPRVGDSDFVRACTLHVPNSYRIANLYDVVTYAPPLILKLPRQDTTFYYNHVPILFQLEFMNGSIAANHIISSYFTALAELDPEFTGRLCSANPGFCPETEANVPKVQVPVK